VADWDDYGTSQRRYFFGLGTLGFVDHLARWGITSSWFFCLEVKIAGTARKSNGLIIRFQLNQDNFHSKDLHLHQEEEVLSLAGELGRRPHRGRRVQLILDIHQGL
jgi:hypothetical protein